MAARWTTTAQASDSHGVKVLTYGPSGAGKTVLLATAPAPVMISAESGLLSLNRANLERLYGVGNPRVTYDFPVYQVTSMAELLDAYKWCAHSHEARQFATVGLDSLTEIAEVCLANLKRGTKDPRQAYGGILEEIPTAVRYFRDLPGKHVYMSAKMEPVKDGLSGAIMQMPAMPGGKLGPMLPYFFDEVFRLGVNTTPEGVRYRFLQTDRDAQHDAKDRSGSLDFMEPPDLSHVFSKILARS